MKRVDHMLFEGYEGLILKDLSSPYTLGEAGRKTKRWLKLKPDYAGLTEDVDVLILAGYNSHSNARKGMTRYLVGVLQSKIDEPKNNVTPLFMTLCRVANGFKRKDLDILHELFGKHWEPWNQGNIPTHFGTWVPTGDNIPACWIPPHKSVVLELKGFELLNTDAHSLALTLRFPRVKAIRYDKKWFECMCASDLMEIKTRITKRKAVSISMSQTSTSMSQQRSRSRPKAIRSVHSSLTEAKLTNVPQRSSIFNALEFCVVSQRDKREIEELIAKHGGRVVQNPSTLSTTYCVACSDSSFKVKNIMRQGKHNIITAGWIRDCDAAQTLLPMKARYYIFKTRDTALRVSLDYDVFNDHYTESCSLEELKAIVDRMKRPLNDVTSVQPWQERLCELLDEEQAVFETEATFFCHCVVYCDLYAVPRTSASSALTQQRLDDDPLMEFVRTLILFYGGRVVEAIGSSTTHIVLRKDEKESFRRAVLFRAVLSSHRSEWNQEPIVVSTQWVEDSVAQSIQLDPTPYQVHLKAEEEESKREEERASRTTSDGCIR